MTVFLGFVGIICSIMMIVQRERVADMIGSGAWMDYVGGVYNVVLLSAILLFFFSIAAMTGTLGVFLAPIRFLLPHPQDSSALNMP